MSSVKPTTTLVFDSFSGNSLIYLIVLFRQKFPLVSVIVVVGLANLSCCCDHCVNVANKPDKKNVRQRTPPSEIILFWSHVTSVFQGLSLFRSVGRVGETPGNEVDHLPVTIRQQSSVSSFKTKLFNYYFTKIDHDFDIVRPRTWKLICPRC